MNQIPQPLPLAFQLQTIKCHRHRESWLGDKPYLWNIFFKIGGESLTILDNFRLDGGGKYHFSKGSHGNLGAGAFPMGHERAIPPEVGEWSTVLHPLLLPHFEAPIPGIIGCIAVLMEQKNLSDKGSEAGHQFLNEYVIKAIDQSLRAFDPRKIDVSDLLESIKRFFLNKVMELSGDLEKRMGHAIMKSQTLLENLWTLVNKDTLIGYHVWTFSHDSLQNIEDSEPFNARFLVGKGGEWEINGVIRRRETAS